MTMQEFFSKAGEFMSSYTQVTGNSPQRRFDQVFFYRNGQARYDGNRWEFKIGI